jgi:RHH-type rel operon transcriptional repressor/antitoxin RelB
MIAIRIDPDMEQTLNMLAKAQGKNRSVIVREALIRYFEDLEDSMLAEETLREMKGTKSLSELRRELGLDG